MRVRDIVRGSFERVIEAGVLPGYERRGRYVPPVARHNPTWRPDQVELVHYGGAEDAATAGLYADPAEWRRAVAFIRSFTAAAAGRGTLPWQVRGWGGSFGEVRAADLLPHVTFALGACGLRALPSHRGSGFFEASDAPTVSALPEPYGRWLQVQEGQARWKDKVELRLAVRVQVRTLLHPDGRSESFVDLDLSAPAISLIDVAATTMGRPLPPGGGTALLDLSRASLTTTRRV